MSGGRALRPPPLTRATLRGGTYWGVGDFQYYICLHFPSSGNLLSTLHCIALFQTIRLRKAIKYTRVQKQYPSKLCLIKIALNIRPCFPFWKLIIFICGSSTKVTRAFLASETLENWRFQKCIWHAMMPLYKWRVTWKLRIYSI